MDIVRRIIVFSVLPAAAIGASVYGSRDVPPRERTEKALKNTRDRFGELLGRPVFLRIIKDEMKLELWVPNKDGGWNAVKNFRILTFGGEPGPKQAEGDGRAPEGFYRVRADQLKPDSNYHLAFNIGYPNAYDRKNGRTGSFIMIHGSRVSVGCYAMGGAAVEEIYTMVDQALKCGQKYVPVQIYPFRMTPQRIRNAADYSAASAFIEHLREGWDFTERERAPFPDSDN